MARRRRRRRRSSRPRTRTITVYRSRGRRRSGGGSSIGRSSKTSLKHKAGIAAGAAAYGYLRSQTTALQFMDRLPTIGNKALTFGLITHGVNSMMVKSKYLDTISAAALAVGAFQFGESGFTMEGGDWTNALDGDLAGYVDVSDVELEEPGVG